MVDISGANNQDKQESQQKYFPHPGGLGLFLLPLGRPLPLFLGLSVAAAVEAVPLPPTAAALATIIPGPAPLGALLPGALPWY